MSAAPSDDVLIGDLQKSRGVRIRVQLRTYNERRFLDLRQFWQAQDAPEPRPSARGFSVPPRKIGELIELLKQAESKAREMGLLDGRSSTNRAA